MKAVFWLLDINYEVRSDVPEIWLWGICESGERILIIDKNFQGYFYAKIEENYDEAEVLEEIDDVHHPSVSNLEVVERRYFGKPVKAVKVFCKSPDAVSGISKTVRKLEGIKDCFEDDIRYSMRYLVDNNVVPCGWHEIEVTEQENKTGIQVDKIYEAKSYPKLIEKTDLPPFRILGFSTIFYSKEGSPRPERNPVIIISAKTNTGEWKQFLADENKSDKTVLEAFVQYIRNFNPDIIVGYGVNEQEWSYLTERCKQVGLRLLADRVKAEPHTSVYSHVSLTGRANVDLADYADEFPEIKVKTLENMADYLGVMKIEDRTIVEDVDFADYWDDQARREVLKKFSMDNAQCVIGIAEVILDFAMQLSNLVDLPLDHVGTAAAGFRVEWFMIKHTHKIGELIPKRIEQPYRPYTGGLVLQPKPGLHENIAILDFKSMYPNLMIAYNLSPDTYVQPEGPTPTSGVYTAPEVNHRFRKEPPGFYKEALMFLISVRQQVRLKMKELNPTSTEYRVLDARQKAIKVITNACYGYAGWTGARWYMKPVAEAAAAWGRHTIKTAIEMVEDAGLKVVYGDTDSIFVESDMHKIKVLETMMEQRLGLEVAPDKVYVRVFFTEAKKRYAGLLPDGRLDIVGLEVVRGDWAAIAKKVQEKVLEIILKEQSPKKAADYVEQFVYELKQRKVPLRDLTVWKTLTKPVDEYEVKAAHVEAARMLSAKGWKLSVGDKIGYVVVVGAGRLYERVKPYIFASYDDVDLDYYVSKQVVPAAARILESFGISEEYLLQSAAEEKGTKKLSDFFS